MQKRIRKNSDYICPKKLKLEIIGNNDQERMDGTTISSQYVQSKDIDINSEPFARSIPSAEATTTSDFGDVNIVDKIPAANPNIKINSKSDTNDTDTIDFKDIYQKIQKSDENSTRDGGVTSSSVNTNKIPSTSVMHLRDISDNQKTSGLSTKQDVTDSTESNAFKLLQRENDILINLDTIATMENINSHVTADGNSLCVSNENDLFASDLNSMQNDILEYKKSVESQPLGMKIDDESRTIKTNTIMQMNAVNDKKKLQTEQQSSAKVSLGNTTISVPLLKPLNLRRFITNNECKSVSNLCKVINIQGKQIKTPTIVQLSQVQLNPKTNTKIVQATLVGNKIQLPNVALKTSANFSMKPNVVTTTQCTMMNPGALPKQIFDDEVVYLEKSVPNSQPQQDEVESRSIENLPINTSNNKPVSKLKDQLNNKLTNSEDYITKTTSPFLTQLRVIEAANTNTSPQTRLTDILPSPITVVTSGENPLPRTTASVSTTISKVSKKPIMLTKTVSPSESLTTSIMNTDSNDILRTTTSSSDGNVPKDNNTPHISDQQAIHKLLEENLLSQKQFTHVVQNGNRLQLKVNKCPERCDDIRTKRPDKNGDFLNKRQPANKLGPFVGSNDITPHEKVNNPKSDDSQNVLLKHLLQSSSNQRTTPPCTQTLAQRKLTTVRAPSLGLVSSLEAQLARPVIPPVPSVGEMKTDIKLPNKTIMGEKISKKLPGERENATIKTRPEIVSRETSFVSSFSPKVKCTEADRTTTITPTSTTVPPMPTISSTTLHQPATTSNIQAILTNIQTSAMITQSNNNFNQAIITSSTNSPGSNSIHSAVPPNMHIGQPSRLSPYTNISQSIEMDSIRRSPFHTTIANANGNTNSINTFTMFKSREEDIINRTPFESNSNPTSTKMSSPENSSEVKNPPQNDGDINVHDKAKQAKLDAENLEMKKRFKRDHQKHKRQILLTKEQQNHQKKKSRKLSKASEDFDEFIDNKVVQMKQMFVLEVLEPLLSTYLGICSIYGYTERPRNEVEPSSHNSSKEEFGKTTIKNVADFYSVKPYGPNQNKQANNVPTFQNKFYDEEFPNMNQISCDKLFQFINNLKQQSLQTPDEITLIHNQPSHSQPSSSSIRTTNYPGIKLQSNMNLNTDRMSPVIPLITPNHFGPFKRRKPPMTTNRKKSSSNNAESSLILTLSSFVAQNVVNILRDLENLLNVNSPISYKLLNTDKLNNINSVHGDRGRILQRTESTNIQNILNGTYKCCRNCHLIIICGIVGADSNANIKKKIMSDSHFCEKFCSIQYKKKGRRFVLSQHKDHCYPNNKALNRVNTGDSACCDISNYKIVTPNCFWRPLYKTMPNSEDVNDVYLKTRVAIALNPNRDVRRCILCNQKRDALPEGASRLLNYDVNKWVHLNCALWSNSVYETTNGGLMNLELTMPQGLHEVCSHCNQLGASVKCFKIRCGHVYHLPCAIKERCVFYKNKTIHCASHAHRLEKKNELSSIRVRRRVYIERDENRQVAAVMHHLDLSNLLRVGSLTFINVGQLLPHQLEAFHTPNCIYPIGYKVIRFFWSTRKLNKRCRYICSIVDSNGRPEFVIQIQEPFESDVELRDVSPKAVWQHVLDKIVELRKGQEVLQIYADFFTGEDLFGLTEPSIVRILESLPGVETLTDYKFKYGRNPLLELPLALNPSGSARTEPKLKQNLNWKKTHTQRTSSINLKLSLSPSSLAPGDVACPYSKQFVHSKSSQYRKMKQEWRNNVYLARSKIQGLGLYAARDLEKHTMVIEYIGQVIRTEVSELREKQYDQRNRGIYMFRLDEERVVDATLSGGLARYINHSCNPNCVTEIVDVDREYRIIIFAKRRINKGEELSYDYKFDIEDDAHKISCMCDAPNCRKWMN